MPTANVIPPPPSVEQLAAASIQPSEYFLRALEAQKAINTHIHEIEPSTPIFLYEINLNQIRPESINYPTTEGPIKNGILRIHNDFNLFNINRGIIKWKGEYYFPFPIYGEQFDITSNGTIPTPKVKFSSQFLDDEFNSFYKYIRMQMNELKDIVGSKVTRRKTFVRYLSADNFEGNVNPFNENVLVPWASRDGDVLTVRSTKRVPTFFSKWLVYYPIPNYNNKLKIFSSLKTDDKTRTLNIQNQIQNHTVESTDFISLYINQLINTTPEVSETFSIDIFSFSGSNNFTSIIPDQTKEFTQINTSNKLKLFCQTYSDVFSPTSSFITTPAFPVSFTQSPDSLISFISAKSNTEGFAQSFNYDITNQTQTGFRANFSQPISGNLDLNYLTIPTGAYTGINPYSNESTNLIAIKIVNNFGSVSSGEYNIQFPLTFNNVPKILFNAQSTSGFIFNQYLKNISNTGCTFVATNTGISGFSLGLQSGFLLATDYLVEDSTPTGVPQIFSAAANLALSSLDNINDNTVGPQEIELAPDVYYIDRKVQEDSVNVVYELASLLDVEGVKLPSRILLSKNCPFTYRGEGCLYERGDRLTPIHSGVYGSIEGIATYESGKANTNNIDLSNEQICIGLKTAPPVADSSDATFANEINSSNWIDKGAWVDGTSYDSGNFIYIEKNEIKYYFVCQKNHTGDSVNAPPNFNYWKSDTCSKTLKGCKLRWKNNPNFPTLRISGAYIFSGYSEVQQRDVGISDVLFADTIAAPKDYYDNQLIGILPFGGFPSVEGKYRSQQGPEGG